MRTTALLVSLVCCLAPPAASGVAEGGAAEHPAGVLRVGTSGDYEPFSRRVGDGDPPAFEGFDVALARAYADSRGLELRLVPFRWKNLREDLAADRFDVAMSGVTVRPERSAVGRFSVPVVETGAVVLVRQPERFPDLDSLNRRIARIGVNRGGHLERVAAARFPRAMRVAIDDNASVREALLAENLHAAVTDTIEATVWLRGTEDLKVLGPFTRDRKALLVRADRAALAADLDAWLLEQEAGGVLAALRREHLGAAAGEPVATASSGLLAAVDERLALMPFVAVAKRRLGLPLEVPEREATVLDAAVASVEAAATEAGVEPPAPEAVRAFFRSLIAAAKQVQWAAIQDPELETPETLPDLETELRPALLRIGDKIARLLVALRAEDAAVVEDLAAARAEARARAGQSLRTPRLSESSVEAIGDALADVSRPAEVPPVASDVSPS